VYIAKLARTLDADAFQANRHCHIPAAVVEQLRVFRRPDQMPSQRPRLEAAALVEFAKMRNRLLNNPPPHPNTAHQTPITVDLPILLACRVAQIHAPNRIRVAALEKYPWSPLHAKIGLSPLPNPLIPLSRCDKSAPLSSL